MAVFGVFYRQDVLLLVFHCGTCQHSGRSPNSSFATERSAIFFSDKVAEVLKDFCAPFSSPVEVGTRTGVGDVVERWCSTLFSFFVFSFDVIIFK